MSAEVGPRSVTRAAAEVHEAVEDAHRALEELVGSWETWRRDASGGQSVSALEADAEDLRAAAERVLASLPWLRS